MILVLVQASLGRADRSLETDARPLLYRLLDRGRLLVKLRLRRVLYPDGRLLSALRRRRRRGSGRGGGATAGWRRRRRGSAYSGRVERPGARVGRPGRSLGRGRRAARLFLS